MLAALTNYGLATPEQIEIWKSLLDEWRDNPGASGAIAFRDCLRGSHSQQAVDSHTGLNLPPACMRLAAMEAAHRLGAHEDPATRPPVKATTKRLAREYGNPGSRPRG